MNRVKKKSRTKKIGLPPGSIIYTGEFKSAPVTVKVVDFNTDIYDSYKAQDLEKIALHEGCTHTRWIEVEGVHDSAVLEKVGTAFKLHPLHLEDIAHVDQRPKIDEESHYIFIIAKMFRLDQKTGEIYVEQVSLAFGTHWLVLFQEYSEDIFDSLRERLRQSKGKIRKMGADYLAYNILDTIVDQYFVVLERLNEKVEEIEESMASNPSIEAFRQIYQLKRDLLSLRKAVWPLRELIGNLQRGEHDVISDSTKIYLKDIYDHTVQIIDTLETSRELLLSLSETYFSSVGHKTNMVMKVLTIITTIFMPLTFISSIYGMNFKHMPELEWHYGYPFALGLMGASALLMLSFFRKKGWM